MTLAETLEQDMKNAMRAGDKLKLGVIRRSRAGVQNAEIAAGGALDDDGVVRVLRGIAKQHRESIDQFRAGGREDLATQEEAELAVLYTYLPAQLDDAALEVVVRDVIAQEGATDVKDMGRVMKGVMARLGAQADGKAVNRIASAILSSK